MHAPPRPPTSPSRAAKRRARPPATSDAPRSALAELAHAILHRDAREQPTPSLLHLIGRLAPFCLRILALIIIVGGGAGALGASPLVYLVVLLIALLVVIAAVDQWFMAPRAVKVDERFVTPRRGRAKSSPKPPPRARSNQPP